MKKLDPLLVGIVAAAALAFLLPARGGFADGFAVAVKLAIALLFFLYGARLSTQEALKGLTNWRLHALILAFTFVIYPVIGLLARPTVAFMSEDLYQGLLFMSLVPSTVQSSVALTGVARGNVSGAVVAASVATAPGGSWPRGVLVAVFANLPRRITSLPTALADDEIDELYAVARRLGTWTREL